MPGLCRGHCLTKGAIAYGKCVCFKYFIVQSEAIFDIVFHYVFVFGPIQSDLYILTDGTLPLPAFKNSQISHFYLLFCMYRLHQNLLCCLNAYVDLVTSNLWTIFWYTTYFHSFSYYVVVSSGETYHWCCNVSCVYIDSILQCLFITCFFSFFGLFLDLLLFLVTLLYHSKLYSQRTCLLGQPQLGLEEYLCLKSVCVCACTPVTVCSSYCFINSFRSQMQLREDKIKKPRKQSSYS